MPDLYLDDIYGITPEMLLERGIRAVLLDIDNTLVTYDDPMPTESVLKWLGALSEAGIKAAFISNNHKDRVELFNSELKYFATWDSGKPFIKCHKRAMAELGTDRDSTAVIGDQIFTDVLGANRVGLTTILVNPIEAYENSFFYLKRALEKTIKTKLAKE